MSRKTLKSGNLERLPGLRLAVLAAWILASVSSLAQSVPDFEQIKASAAAARDQGDVAGAIQLYGQAVELNPQWTEGWWFLGNLQYRADQYTSARDALTHFIDLTPRAGPALALRGLCEFEIGQYPESLQDLQHGIALGAASQPRNAPILLYHQAILLTKLGSFEDATQKYSVFAKQGKVDENVVLGIGLAGVQMPLFPSEIGPANTELVAMAGRAGLAVMSGDAARGQQAFAELFKRFPETPHLHYFYGYLLFSTDLDRAVAEFREEVRVSPTNANAYAMLAWVSELRGDFAESLPSAEKAASQDPRLPVGQLVLGRALVETGDVTGGLLHLESVLKTEPGNLEAHLTLAKAYSKLGRKEDARRERLLCLQLSGQGAAPNATP